MSNLRLWRWINCSRNTHPTSGRAFQAAHLPQFIKLNFLSLLKVYDSQTWAWCLVPRTEKKKKNHWQIPVISRFPHILCLEPSVLTMSFNMSWFSPWPLATPEAHCRVNFLTNSLTWEVACDSQTISGKPPGGGPIASSALRPLSASVTRRGPGGWKCLCLLKSRSRSDGRVICSVGLSAPFLSELTAFVYQPWPQHTLHRNPKGHWPPSSLFFHSSASQGNCRREECYKGEEQWSRGAPNSLPPPNPFPSPQILTCELDLSSFDFICPSSISPVAQKWDLLI